jgi:hypothetical protein
MLSRNPNPYGKNIIRAPFFFVCVLDLFLPLAVEAFVGIDSHNDPFFFHRSLNSLASAGVTTLSFFLFYRLFQKMKGFHSEFFLQLKGFKVMSFFL